MRKNYDSSKSDRKRKSRKLNKGSKMIIHTRIKYSILLIIPLILLNLLPTVSAANDNRISNENSKSIEALKQAIRIDPDYADAHYNFGNAYVSSGMYKEAIEEYKQAIRINPDFAEVHNNLGGVYVKSGMHKEASEAFWQAIRINPDFAEAYNNLGIAYGKSGMHKEAIEVCKQAVWINPDFAKAHYCLGIIYVSLNDKGSALEQYEILKSLDSELANKLFKLINK